MFIDQVVVRVEAGTGGSGAEAFHREAMNPLGGPSGGTGGDGGSVILLCDPQLSTLLDFRYRAEYRAERGEHGQGRNRTGRRGSDLELRVPPGTIVRDSETDEFLAELLEPGERYVVARGGRGGRGNASFATATRQAPTHWEPGEEGEQRTVELTLKLMADVGLVGEPNAGKSTFLAAISEARPRVADYPFTTLTPNLGVVELPDFRSFVVADIPGIIEGAHQGRGLGHQFLQHIERTRTLALLLPVTDEDPQQRYEQLRGELAAYSPELAERPHCVLLTKADLMESGTPPPPLVAPGAWGTFLISSVSGRGISELLEVLWRKVREAAAEGVGEDRISGPGPDGAGPTGSVVSDEVATELRWWAEAEGDR